MSDENLGDCSSWRRIARLLLTATDMVKQQGSGVILKWDGAREDGKIYTIVWEGDESGGPRFRSDTDDLEVALRQFVSAHECSALQMVPKVAASISTIDRAARASFVISLRMTQSAGVFHITK